MLNNIDLICYLEMVESQFTSNYCIAVILLKGLLCSVQSLAMVASTPEVAATQLQVGQGSELHNITLTSNPMRLREDTVNTVSELHPHSQASNGLGGKSALEEKIRYVM